jgi:hypothetical protein
MAGVAIVVGRDASGNGLAGAGWFVARHASFGRAAIPLHMRSVVKPHIETLDKIRGEDFHPR